MGMLKTGLHIIDANSIFFDVLTSGRLTFH